MQKNVIYITAVLILCTGSFFSGKAGSGRTIEGMEGRIRELQGQIDSGLEIIGALRKENNRLNGTIRGLNAENRKLESDIDDLQRINIDLGKVLSGIHDANSEIGSGITEAQTGIGSVIEGIGAYLQETQTSEPDNNR